MLAHFGHHVVAALLTPLLPFIRDDFALDYTQTAWVVSAFTLAYGVSQLPAGWLADRIGARLLITIGICGVALSGLLVGLSPTYTIMVIFLMLMGIMGGGYHPAASPLVSASVGEKNRGRALGLHQIGGTASFFLTPLIAVGLATAFGGWRGAFLALSVPTFIFGVIFYLLLGRRKDTAQPEHSLSDRHTEITSPPGHIRRLVAFTILGIALQVLLFSVQSFIPLFVVDRLNRGKEAAAVLLAIYNSAGLWAGPLGGYLADRIGKVPILLTVGVIAGPVIYLLNFVSFGWSLFVILLMMGMFQYISMPVSELYIISHTSERHRSTVLGIYYFASRGGPGLAMPVIGRLIDWSGFGTTFTILGASLLVIALGCSAFLWRSRD